jgi:glucose-6-phosphate isomerase
VANFLVFLKLLKEHCPGEYTKYIVVTTNYDSKLWQLGQKEGFACLEIPEKVGGRYSVFSAVGLFPLGLLGIDTAALLSGAKDMVATATELDVHANPAAVSASIKYLYYEQGVRIHDFFSFGESLKGIGMWYRQLMGESLGKTSHQHGKEVPVGITPTASVGTTDLHSVGQLYLGGPRDKLITFARVVECLHTVVVPHIAEYDALVPHIEHKTFATLMGATFEGVLKAYAQDARPYVELVIPQMSAYYVGQVLQLYMIEMMYLGYLLNVDPFDQPHVELYKEQTRKILAHE